MGRRRARELPVGERWPKRTTLPDRSIIIVDKGVPTLMVNDDDRTPTRIDDLVPGWPDPWPEGGDER